MDDDTNCTTVYADDLSNLIPQHERANLTQASIVPLIALGYCIKLLLQSRVKDFELLWPVRENHNHPY